jgi:hypothetical protein
MRKSDAQALAVLRHLIGSKPELHAVGGKCGLATTPPKSMLSDLLRHQLFLTIVGFFLTSIIGGSLTYWFSSLNQSQQIAETTRNSAISAVGDIAQLVGERRQRASLLIVEIERGASRQEAEALKRAYDEAFVQWNVKLPTDILRVKAGLGSRYPLFLDRYMNSLVNFNFLVAGSDVDLSVIAKMPKRPGLVSIMHTCLNDTYDAYRDNEFKMLPKVQAIISDCKFHEVNEQFIICVGLMFESLYDAVSDLGVLPAVLLSQQKVLTDCAPP